MAATCCRRGRSDPVNDARRARGRATRSARTAKTHPLTAISWNRKLGVISAPNTRIAASLSSSVISSPNCSNSWRNCGPTDASVIPAVKAPRNRLAWVAVQTPWDLVAAHDGSGEDGVGGGEDGTHEERMQPGQSGDVVRCGGRDHQSEWQPQE